MNAERELQVTHYAATGRPVSEIAHDLGVTRQRVDQMFSEIGLKTIWFEASVMASEVQPEPPVRICHWCGREVEQLPEWRHAHWTHAECTRAYGVYCNRVRNNERYRTDPAYRQAHVDYQRAHPNLVAEMGKRYRENMRHSLTHRS